MNETSGYRVVSSSHVVTTNFDPIIEKIKGFGSLKTGWSFGEGRPISQDVLVIAESLYVFGRSLGLKANAFPGLHGDIAIAFYQRAKCFEVVVHANFEIDIHIEEGEGFNFSEIEEMEQVPIETAYSKLRAFTGIKEWTSRESSILSMWISFEGDFQTLPLNTQQEQDPIPPIRRLASQYSILTVLAQP